MAKLSGGRPGFREWVDKQPDPSWSLLPLTHISKGLTAEDIIRADAINVSADTVFNESVAYFFYGRPAYKVTGDGALKLEAACPFCFIFEPSILKKARAIHAFDTGAFSRRLYSRIMMNEMQIEDFSLETDELRPNRLIARVFESKSAYFDGDTTKIKVDAGAEAWEFHARAYLELLTSPGRNEPDDRICSIEVVFVDPVPLKGNLKAVIVPHTLWDGEPQAPWLKKLALGGVDIKPYLFIPGRHPEHYQTLLEVQVRDLYMQWGLI